MMMMIMMMIDRDLVDRRSMLSLAFSMTSCDVRRSTFDVRLSTSDFRRATCNDEARCGGGSIRNQESGCHFGESLGDHGDWVKTMLDVERCDRDDLSRAYHAIEDEGREGYFELRGLR